MSTPTPEDQAALQEFYNSTVPLSQVRESLNLPDGQYDLAITKMEPMLDDDKKVSIQMTVRVLAPASIANLPSPQCEHRERFFIGNDKDPMAKLPETRLNSFGFGKLKTIARVCQLPTNDQPVAVLCAGLIGKSFGCRIEASTNKKTGKTYTGLGRNPTPLGVVPPRLDTEGAAVGVVVAAAPAAAAAPAGSFGTAIE